MRCNTGRRRRGGKHAFRRFWAYRTWGTPLFNEARWRCVMRCAWGVLFLSLFISASASLAQTVGASLQGTVYDPSGRFVPGAQIEIQSVEKNAVRSLVTDDKGRYREPLLPPGEYELR